MRRPPAIALVAAAVVAFAPCGPGVLAQEAPGAASPEAVAARALFGEARKDEQAGRWGDALGKFRNILQARETASVRFHAAYCEEKLGHLTAAYRDYARALKLARTTPGPDRKLIIDQSGAGLAGLSSRVARLVVQLPREVTGARVTVDGAEVPSDEAAEAMPLEPGRHVLEVAAPGKRPFRREFTIEQPKEIAVLVLFEEAPAPAAPAPPPAASTAPAAPPPPAPADGEASGRRGGSSLAPWVVGGASVALAGVATGFFFVGRARGDKLDECRSGQLVCRESDLRSSRTRSYAIAGSAGALALVGAGVAVVLALSGGGDDAPASKAASGLVVGPGGLGWAGRF
jgi:hypothetical protein